MARLSQWGWEKDLKHGLQISICIYSNNDKKDSDEGTRGRRGKREEKKDCGDNFHDEKKRKKKGRTKGRETSMFQNFHLTSIKNDTSFWSEVVR